MNKEDLIMVYFEKMKKLIRNNQKYLVAIIVIAFMLLLLYSPIIFDGWKLSFTNVTYSFSPFDSLGVKTKGPFLSDPADNVYPIAYQSIHNLTFTSWISMLGIGAPQSMSIYLFFLNYVYLLPFDIAPLVISIVKVLIAFFAMYFYMKHLKISRIGCYISSVSYALCSTMVVWHGWPHSEVTMLAPLLFLVMDLLLEKIKVSTIVCGSLIIFCMLVAGMPTYTAYFMYLVGCYVLYYGLKKYWNDKRKLLGYFFSFFACVVFGALLSLPYTLELLQTVGGNGYNDSRKGLAEAKLSLDYLRTLFFPYVREDLTIHVNEATLYTGILAMVSLPLSFLNIKKKPKNMFFLVSLIVLFVLVFTNLLSPIYQMLPLVNTSIRYRLIVLINFSLSVLVGVNIGDIFENSADYKKKKFFFVSLLGIGIGFFYIAYSIIDSYKLSKALNEQVDTAKLVLIALFVICVITLFVKNRVTITLCKLSLIILVIIDMAGFGSYYLPLISNDASVIPPITDSLSYVKENTKNQEKTASIGQWTFFASNNMYYNIRDIRGHNFVYTNKDIKNYYEAIDDEAYSTPTRIAFHKIDNENLLKYLGVKYILSESEGASDREPFISGVTPLREFYEGEKVFTQTFTATENNLSTLKLMIGTYQGKFTEQDSVSIQLIDLQSDEIIRQASTSLYKQKDNDYITFSFDPIGNSKDTEYKLVIKTNVQEEHKITFYASNEKSYEGDFSETDYRGNLVLQPFYSTQNERIGGDGITVRELEDFSQQIQLTDEIITEKTSKDVLSSMENNYRKNRVYFSKEDNYPNVLNSNKLSAEESISSPVNNRDGTISFDATVDESRVVLINEYNDGNWDAYIDGQKTTVYKGNYLFRAIVIPKGNHTIVLKHNSKSLFISWIVTGVTVVVLLILVLFRKKLQTLLSKYGITV